MVSFCCSCNNFPMTVTNGVEIHSLSQIHPVCDNQKINHQTDYHRVYNKPHLHETLLQPTKTKPWHRERQRERDIHTHTHTYTCTTILTILSLSLSLAYNSLSGTVNILSQIQLSHHHINTFLSQILFSLSLNSFSLFLSQKQQASKDGSIWLWVSLW
jgi:hypothetical protein